MFHEVIVIAPVARGLRESAMKHLLSAALVACCFAVFADSAAACGQGRQHQSGSVYTYPSVGPRYDYMPRADAGVRVYSAQGGTSIAPAGQASESAYFDPSVTAPPVAAPAVEEILPPQGFFVPLRRVPAFPDYQPNDNWN